MSGSMGIKEIVDIQKEYPQYNNIKSFVETGTFHGGTIFHMANFFERLYTIELYEKHYQNAVNNAKKNNVNNINFYLGDSSVVLEKLAVEIKEPSIFYLDSHFCGRKSRSVSAQGHFPLFGELRAINDLRNYNDIVVVDDYRLFGKIIAKKALDWREVTEENVMRNFDKNKVLFSLVRNDRFWILLRDER